MLRIAAAPQRDRKLRLDTDVTRLVVVSAVRLYREGLADLLDRREGISVVAAVADVDEAARVVMGQRAPADMVLVDMGAPESLEAASRLRTAAPDLRVIAVAAPNTEIDLIARVEAGVAGFVTPEASMDDLVCAIEGVARGELLCSPALAGALGRRIAALARAQESGRDETVSAVLTSREREIVHLIDEGLSNKEIARHLHIEVPTVKNHVHHILGKLGVRRRAEAAARVRAKAELFQRD